MMCKVVRCLRWLLCTCGMGCEAGKGCDDVSVRCGMM